MRDPVAVSPLRKSVLWIAAAPLLVVALVTTAWAVDGWLSTDRVARNVTLAGTPVGNETPDELDRSVDELAAELPSTTIEIDAEDFTLTTTAGDLGLSVDRDRTVERVMEIGRGDPLPVRPVRWLQSWFGERSADVVLTIDSEQLAEHPDRARGRPADRAGGTDDRGHRRGGSPGPGHTGAGTDRQRRRRSAAPGAR